MRLSQTLTKYHYESARLRDLKAYGVRSSLTGRVTITGIEIDGELFAPSPCFWKTLLNRFLIPTSTLELFDAEEIVERLKEQAADARIRYCVERDQLGNATILAVCEDVVRVDRFERSVDTSTAVQ